MLNFSKSLRCTAKAALWLGLDFNDRLLGEFPLAYEPRLADAPKEVLYAIYFKEVKDNNWLLGWHPHHAHWSLGLVVVGPKHDGLRAHFNHDDVANLGRSENNRITARHRADQHRFHASRLRVDMLVYDADLR